MFTKFVYISYQKNSTIMRNDKHFRCHLCFTRMHKGDTVYGFNYIENQFHGEVNWLKAEQ